MDDMMNNNSLVVGSNRKIDPSRRAHLKADMTPDDNNRVEIGPTGLAFAEWEERDIAPHMPELREYRLARLQEQIRQADCAGLLLFDPLNIRYATDTTNMQLWTTHNAARACFVPPEGKVILWDFHNCEHLSAHLPLVGELRGGASFFILRQAIRQSFMPNILRLNWSILCITMPQVISGLPLIRLKMLVMRPA